MTTSHAPTPYSVKLGAFGHYIEAAIGGDPVAVAIRDKATADFLALAANTHDEARDTLRDVLRDANDFLPIMDNDGPLVAAYRDRYEKLCVAMGAAQDTLARMTGTAPAIPALPANVRRLDYHVADNASPAHVKIYDNASGETWATLPATPDGEHKAEILTGCYNHIVNDAADKAPGIMGEVVAALKTIIDECLHSKGTEARNKLEVYRVNTATIETTARAILAKIGGGA